MNKKHYTNNKGKHNTKKDAMMSSLKKHLNVSPKKEKSPHDKLLRLLEIKESQWHDEEYDAGKDW